MTTKACLSSAANPLSNVRHYGSQSSLTPGERDLLDALMKYGGVTKAATALGLSPRSTASRMSIIREKIGATSSADAVTLWRARRDAA
jgi:FixJ family two-component response regulator